MRRLTKFRLERTKQFLLFIVLVGFVTGRYYCNAEWETWIKERSSDRWERIVPQFTSDEWRENFRMSPETFGYFALTFSHILLKQDTHIRKEVSVKRMLAITLWRLSTNADYGNIVHLFGIAKSTGCEIVEEARHLHEKGTKCQEKVCHYFLATINKCRLLNYCVLIWHC